jgi:hypothetical protein
MLKTVRKDALDADCPEDSLTILIQKDKPAGHLELAACACGELQFEHAALSGGDFRSGRLVPIARGDSGAMNRT